MVVERFKWLSFQLLSTVIIQNTFLSHLQKAQINLRAFQSPSQPEFPNANRDVQNMIGGISQEHRARTRAQTSILIHL